MNISPSILFSVFWEGLKERRAEKEKQSGAQGGVGHKKCKFMAIMSFLEPRVRESSSSNYNIDRPIDSQDWIIESLLLPMVSQVEVGLGV